MCALAPAIVRAQTDYDTDGQTIGSVTGNARVGYNTAAPITVYTDASTNVNNNLDIYNNATLEMPAGDSGYFITAHNSSKIVMSGGKADFSLKAADNSLVTITGGLVANNASANNSGTVVFTGGIVQYDLLASDSGVITLNGGTVGRDVSAFGNSSVTISKGRVGNNVSADYSSVVTWTGGSIGGTFYVGRSAVLRIHGDNLTATPSGGSGGYNLFTLAGHLTDGTDITGKVLQVANNGAASYQLINGPGSPSDVPEPGVVAFGVVALGAAAGLIVRKRRSSIIFD